MNRAASGGFRYARNPARRWRTECRPLNDVQATGFGDAVMSNAHEIIKHSYDVVIVGVGGAGLRAALGMAAD